ncbi:MAG: DUF3027 domain-containing protein [Actinomycetales bacterium]|nr:DUF3027 domain-containing protein [Actinomycetales bacterium]
MAKISNLAQQATDVAQSVLSESVGANQIGKPLTVLLEESAEANVQIALHTFECTAEAYPGWYWAVSVVALSGQDYATVSEINLLPGAEALVPPAWQPWADRVQAGDLGPGDILPPPENDARLAPGFTDIADLTDDLAGLHPTQWELGLGREQVLSEVGLAGAVSRWLAGQTGPRSAMAKAAPADCSTCGYLIPIGGSLGQAFGICGNEFGGADGKIVAMSFGCGAHSGVEVKLKPPVPIVELAVDDFADELEPVSSSASVDDSENSEEDAG